MTNSVVLRGNGLLADAIDRALRADSGGTQVHRDPVDTDIAADMLVAAHDSWQPALSEPGAATGPRLTVRTELGRALIGPVEWPGQPGCMRCVETRKLLATERPSAVRAVLTQHSAALAERPSRWLTPLAASLLGELTASRVREAARIPRANTEPARWHTVLIVDLDTLAVSSHSFLPDPWCVGCGRLPDDSAELATITIKPRHKPATDVYRLARTPITLDSLAATFFDPETGLVRTIRTDSKANVAVASAPFWREPSAATEYGFGRTASFPFSKRISLLEALERYGGLIPGGKRTVVHARFDEISDVAVDPRSLGAFPAEPYEPEDAPLTPYRHDASRYWVWGFSFARGESVLVPQSNVYYRTQHRYPADPLFTKENSNGCALGSCLEEAILHGLLEVLERDAFLLTWYARMSIPRVEWRGAANPRIAVLGTHIENQTGYAIEVFDTTLEEGVPCVLATAANPVDDGRAAVVCAASCHPDPEQAVLQALYELGPILGEHLDPPAWAAARAAELLADPRRVQRMDDHALLYTQRKMLPRLDFLLRQNRQRIPIDKAFAADRRLAPSLDLSEDLRSLVRRCTDNGLDVVAIDQTTPEHRAGGFRCVKVLVPGMVPMTFGHRHRRVHGLPRLLEVPHRLGYRNPPLTVDQLNQDPHPFP